MTDRYENIRKALAMGPTPGAWYLDGEGVRALVRDANGVIVAVRHRMPGHKNETNMRLIAACDPDTIRVLLAERDALAEALRELEEREQRDEALLRQALEVLSRANQTAMVQTLKARIPECAEFGGVAQDLDFVVAALRERLGEGAEP